MKWRDDGEGYPAEVLKYMNDDENEKRESEQGNRVGLWSIRRLLELMYERKGLFQISNVEPHGALSQIYIPEKVVHEVRNCISGENGID